MDNNTSSLMHSLDSGKKNINIGMSLLILTTAIILGVGTGYMMKTSLGHSPLTNMLPGSNNANNGAAPGKSYGSDDTKLYKDSTEGKLMEGGIEGEGQYHLVRPGGQSQNVYLTSSTLDLSQFLNQKIKVWGQTQTAQKAGWLMDVGRVEVMQ